jgi:tetratricopeptide (TPR) repeat protein
MNRRRNRPPDVLIVGENPTVDIHVPVSLTTLQAPRLPNHRIFDRDKTLASLKTFAKQGRCIGVYGPPAMGKTVLAAMFCWKNKAFFPDGIIWTRFGPSATSDTVFNEMVRVAGCLGVSDSSIKKVSTVKEASVLLAEAIGNRRIIFVVDDVWDSGIAAHFHFGGPNSCILLTTRNMQVAEKFAGACVVGVGRLNETDTIRFFQDQLKDTPELQKQIPSLAAITGGCPLSVIIACANFRRAYYPDNPSKALTLVNAYLRDTKLRMNMKVEMPTSLRPLYQSEDASVSLGVAIEQSWSSLSPTQQLLLKSTTLFPADPNSFPKDALLEAAASNENDLSLLADASLILFEEYGRLKVHQTVADFLIEQGLLSPIYSYRALSYWSSFCDKNIERTSVALANISVEAVNLEHFLRYVDSNCDDSQFIHCVSALATLFEIRGNYKRAAALLKRTVTWLGSKPKKVHSAELYGRLGSVSEKAGNYRLAETLYKLALKIKNSSAADKAYVLQNYGVLASKIGRPKQSLYLYGRGLKIARKSKNPARMAAILKNIGAQTVRTGQFSICKAALSEALRLSRRLRDPSRLAGILTNLGFLQICQGEFGNASRLLKRALKIESGYGHTDKMCMVLTYMAIIDLKQGQVRSAKILLTRALRLARRSHLQRRSLAKSYLALCYWTEGKFFSAALHVRGALKLSMQLGNRENIINALIVSGKINLSKGNFASSIQLLHQAIELSKIGGYIRLSAIARLELGNAHLRQGLVAIARRFFRQAKTLARRMPLPEILALSDFGLAKADLQTGKMTGTDRKRVQIALAILQKMHHNAAEEIKDWIEQNVI